MFQRNFCTFWWRSRRAREAHSNVSYSNGCSHGTGQEVEEAEHNQGQTFKDPALVTYFHHEGSTSRRLQAFQNNVSLWELSTWEEVVERWGDISHSNCNNEMSNFLFATGWFGPPSGQRRVCVHYLVFFRVFWWALSMNCGPKVVCGHDVSEHLSSQEYLSYREKWNSCHMLHLHSRSYLLEMWLYISI